MALLRQAQGAAEELLRRDPGLRQREQRALLDQVKRLFSENPDSFN